MNNPKNTRFPKISLLHATRGRPEKASVCREQWLGLANSPESVEHVFAVDSDDAHSRKALASFDPVITNIPGGGCVAAWNLASLKSSGEILIQLSDDWIPPKSWDRLIVSAIGDLCKPAVLRVSDGHRTDDLLCIAILTRSRLEQQGFLFSPEYQGVYSDDEFSFRAYRDGLIVDARSLCFTHAHPHYDSGIPFDQTYLTQNSELRKRRGLVTFARRNPEAFGKWIHHGTDERKYRANASADDLQNQLVDAWNEISRLLDREDQFTKHIEELAATVDRLQAASERWRSDSEFWRSDSARYKAAVDNWNRCSWFTRALHKLRLPKEAQELKRE